jgi:hypothetical protein
VPADASAISSFDGGALLASLARHADRSSPGAAELSWLTNRYQLNDPNIVNLMLAIFEPIAIVSVIANVGSGEKTFSTGSPPS